MFQIDPQTAALVVPPAIGVVVWLVRLEGRVNAQDGRHKELRADIHYIRERIDHALNGRRHDD